MNETHTLATLTDAARISTATILAQSGEMPKDVDALLLMDEELALEASAMISEGWGRLTVLQSIGDALA